MKIPDHPPDIQPILKEAVREAADSSHEVAPYNKILSSGPTDHKGRYLHWEEMRHKQFSGPLTREQVWAGMKMARMRLLKPLLFSDKHGERFRYAEPDCVRRTLRWLDLNCGGAVTSARDTGSDRDGSLYLARSLLEEPISSSILEGAATTRAKARQMIEQERAPKDMGEKMVMNNYLAMREIARLKDQELTPELVFEIHRIITEGTLDNPDKAGVFRDENDQVDVVDKLDNILHHPPEADELEKRMVDLCEFANGSEEDEPYVHPISRAIILHFMLAYDHPFVDGNGRVARALFYWSALRSGYWMMKYVSISHIIMEAPAQYGMAFLKVETDGQDVTYFLDHQLDVLRRAIEELQVYLERQRTKFIAFEGLLTTSKNARFNLRQVALLKDLHKKISQRAIISEHQNRFGVSYLTARKDIEDLVHLNLLRKKKVGRQSIYQTVPEFDQELAKITTQGRD